MVFVKSVEMKLSDLSISDLWALAAYSDMQATNNELPVFSGDDEATKARKAECAVLKEKYVKVFGACIAELDLRVNEIEIDEVITST